jgi:hypothetical protein
VISNNLWGDAQDSAQDHSQVLIDKNPRLTQHWASFYVDMIRLYDSRKAVDKDAENKIKAYLASALEFPFNWRECDDQECWASNPVPIVKNAWGEREHYHSD